MKMKSKIEFLFQLMVNLQIILAYGDDAQKSFECERLSAPKNGYLLGGGCSNKINAACGFGCFNSYVLVGSTLRICTVSNSSVNINLTNTTLYAKWNGTPAQCILSKCKPIKTNPNLILNCTSRTLEVGTVCYQSCSNGYRNLGSAQRICASIQKWSGVQGICKEIEKPTLSDIVLTTSIQTTTSVIPLDFKNYSVVLTSIKRQPMPVRINTLPITITFWVKSHVTQSLMLWNFTHACHKIILATDSYGRFQIVKDDREKYILHTFLNDRQWTQVTTIIDTNILLFYINGALELSAEADFITCFNETDTSKTSKIADDSLSVLTLDIYVKRLPRKKDKSFDIEITRFNIISGSLLDEEVAELYFYCESVLLDENNLIFTWSNISSYMPDVEYRLAKFCMNCEEPKQIANAQLSYTGTLTGDSRVYKCYDNAMMRGYATSVCMVYGDWSHAPPSCELIYTRT